MMHARPYEPGMQPDWDTSVRSAHSAHFMFERSYMDYHRDRFEDASLVFEKDGRLMGVMPLSRHGEQLISHGGLSFGGLLCPADRRLSEVQSCFEALIERAQQDSVRSIVYKAIPSIYQCHPFEADLYLLRKLGAEEVRQDVNTVVRLDQRLPLQTRRKRGAKLAAQRGVTLEFDSDAFSEFWQVLSENLSVRHSTAPVHSLKEIQLLRARFSEFIRLHVARHEDHVVAGVVTFQTARVVHAQYLATSTTGQEYHAMDLLLSQLLDRVQENFAYFSFGVSSFDSGRQLNQGLLEQKEGFGGRVLLHRFYELHV